MKKVTTKPIIAAALLAGVMGMSSVPLNASAYNGNRWDNNSWNRDHDRWQRDDNNRDNRRHVSDWEARDTARRFFPNRHIVHEEDRWDNNGRHEHRFRFDDNHCVDVRDDGVVVRVFVFVNG
jgi:hypothetical protein